MDSDATKEDSTGKPLWIFKVDYFIEYKYFKSNFVLFHTTRAVGIMK